MSRMEVLLPFFVRLKTGGSQHEGAFLPPTMTKQEHEDT